MGASARGQARAVRLAQEAAEKREKWQCRMQLKPKTKEERQCYIREEFYTTRNPCAYLKHAGAAVFSSDVTAAIKRADGAAGLRESLGKIVRFLADSRGCSRCAGKVVGVSTVREFTGDASSIPERQN